ncbi:hypothetical protein MAR_011728 [Mya arenaria]|uniref:Uncharacterized protein n=1 Tax=Mya arenaria TaxID=6604 RepID=A0ABY7FXK5_MYAAR|nr:uncharacterized protein LOC128217937 [Mya arenaria]WAR26024.1 hypothetical protein MAR_011728 [Mya arenaria]
MVIACCLKRDGHTLKSLKEHCHASQEQSRNVNVQTISVVLKDYSNDPVSKGNSAVDDSSEPELAFWCRAGCVSTVCVSALIFLALPAGILLCVYASNNADNELLTVGIIISCLPILTLPLIVLVLFNRRCIRSSRS